MSHFTNVGKSVIGEFAVSISPLRLLATVYSLIISVESDVPGEEVGKSIVALAVEFGLEVSIYNWRIIFREQFIRTAIISSIYRHEKNVSLYLFLLHIRMVLTTMLLIAEEEIPEDIQHIVVAVFVSRIFNHHFRPRSSH